MKKAAHITRTFEGPPYPTGRRKNESVGEFIRRKQVEELRKGCKNLFGPVRLDYVPCEDHRRELAARLRRKPRGRVDNRPEWTVYEEMMEEKRRGLTGKPLE